jgi:hypothetical protein
LAQMPSHIRKCRIIYEIRGQAVAEQTLDQIRDALKSDCSVEFKR